MFATKGQFKSIRAILQAHGAFYSGFSTMLQKREMIRQRIENQRIQPGFNRAGTYWGSVVFAHYLRRVKTFSKL